MSLYNDLSRYVAPPTSLPLSQTENPYWDIVRAIPGSALEWRFDHRWAPDWTALYTSENYISRNEFCRRYTWAIPDPMSLEFVALWLKPKAIEIGAGAGYWSWQLSQLGIDIVAYDIDPPDKSTENRWHTPRDKNEKLLKQRRSVFYPIQEGGPSSLQECPDRTLFLCWPPMSEMAFQCLESYEGKRLVYIGEGGGGCTGNDAFFERLDEAWEEVASHPIIQWWAINDEIIVYERQ